MMTSVENFIQSPCGPTPTPDTQSPETETHVHQPENGSGDPAALMPEMADLNHMIDADSDDSDGNNDSDQSLVHLDGNYGPSVETHYFMKSSGRRRGL